MISIYGATDVGLARKINQDRFAFEVLGEDLAYVVLCDGMGGPAGGHVASETATGFVREALSRELTPDLSEQSLKAVMTTVAAGANAMVFDAARKEPDLAGMGTTLILAVFRGDHVHITYAGDSRVYRIRAGELEQLTRDHTVVQMLLDLGEISAEEAKDHPKRHLITRAVGVSGALDADYMEESFLPGDRVLLCSDGLYNYADPETLLRLSEACLAEQSADALIDAANASGGGDNITAVLVARSQESPSPRASSGEATSSWTPAEVE